MMSDYNFFSASFIQKEEKVKNRLKIVQNKGKERVNSRNKSKDRNRNRIKTFDSFRFKSKSRFISSDSSQLKFNMQNEMKMLS